MSGRFAYILAGWEGSAADSRVLYDALSKDFVVPTGKYYLADAGTVYPSESWFTIGYALSTQFLTPYRGVRYHLKEWAQIPDARPTTPKELFNLRHSSLRNVIERSFGVIKQRFPILKLGCEYSLNTQIKMFPALALLSNYIRAMEDDAEDVEYWDEDETNDNSENDCTETVGRTEDGRRAIAMRDVIAQRMWLDYQDYLQLRSSI
jgi:hypothetical protein